MNIPKITAFIAGVLSSGLMVSAVTPLASGHVDVGIGFEDDALNLHVHDEEHDVEYSPADALLVVNPQALQFSPGGAYSFLGPAGTPNWVLPSSETPDLLFLGIGGEELDPADWIGNLTLRLDSVQGPGSFYLWNVDSFGQPVLYMDSSGPAGVPGSVSVVPGSHGHYNWGFSAPGSYRVTFDASGTHVAEGPQSTGPVAFQFQVVPEPQTWALMVIGSMALGLWFWKRR